MPRLARALFGAAHADVLDRMFKELSTLTSSAVCPSCSRSNYRSTCLKTGREARSMIAMVRYGPGGIECEARVS